MSFIDTSYLGSSLHDLLLLNTINTYNLHPIPWLNNINIVIKCYNSNCMRSLSLWHILGQLLKFYKLFIGEFTKIVNDLITVIGFTIFTGFGLVDFSILKGDSAYRAAFHTAKCCCFHFRYNIWCSDNYSSERNESIDLFLTDIPHDFNIP